jgi:CRP/FNR family transcriptional regulator, anaerobic regulatory protein
MSAVQMQHDHPRAGFGLQRADAGTLADLMRLVGAHGADLDALACVPVLVRRVHADATLFHEGGHADAVYFVRAGTFKTFRTAEDGYEQVIGFCGRAEVLGLDAVCSGRHPSAAVALEESSVYVMPLNEVFTLGQRHPQLERAMLLAASSQLTRGGEIADVMAAVAAEVRLARFLVQWSQRMAACGQSSKRFHLRMSRRDIASHLGLAHETISRSFSALAHAGCVGVNNREVEILDPEGLRDFARSTRGSLDELQRAQPLRAAAARHAPLHVVPGARAA